MSEHKCFCGITAKYRNTVKDQRGVNGATVYVYSTCDEHWDSNPPEMWAPSARQAFEKLPEPRLPEGHQPVNYVVINKINWQWIRKIWAIARGQK